MERFQSLKLFLCAPTFPPFCKGIPLVPVLSRSNLSPRSPNLKQFNPEAHLCSSTCIKILKGENDSILEDLIKEKNPSFLHCRQEEYQPVAGLLSHRQSPFQKTLNSWTEVEVGQVIVGHLSYRHRCAPSRPRRVRYQLCFDVAHYYVQAHPHVAQMVFSMEIFKVSPFSLSPLSGSLLPVMGFPFQNSLARTRVHAQLRLCESHSFRLNFHSCCRRQFLPAAPTSGSLSSLGGTLSTYSSSSFASQLSLNSSTFISRSAFVTVVRDELESENCKQSQSYQS